MIDQGDIFQGTPVGNFEDDWDKLAGCDWVIEVVKEREHRGYHYEAADGSFTEEL